MTSQTATRVFITVALLVCFSSASLTDDVKELTLHDKFQRFLAKRRNMQEDFPSCADRNERCNYFAKSGILASTEWDESQNVYSDRGFCIVNFRFRDYVTTTCQRSCGECQSQCVDEYELVRGEDELSCAELLSLEPDACSCADNSENDREKCEGKSTQNGVDLLWMRNWCQKTCYDAGFLPNSLPCFNPCDVSTHPCKEHIASFNTDLAGKYRSFQYKCPNLFNHRPYETTKHNTEKIEDGQRWCPLVETYTLADKFQYSYCSCEEFTIPTTYPTASPTAFSTEEPTHSPTVTRTDAPTGASETRSPTKADSLAPTRSPSVTPTLQPTRQPTSFKQSNEYVEQVFREALARCRTNCSIDLSTVLQGTTRQDVPLCYSNSIRVESDIDIYDSKGQTTIWCATTEDGCAQDWPGYLFNIEQGHSLTLRSVRVERCKGVAIVRNEASFRAKDSFFLDNDASNSNGGGVIDVAGRLPVVEFHNCTLKNNVATEGGVIGVSRAGQNVTVHISNSHFEGNRAEIHGGVLSYNLDSGSDMGNIFIHGSTFHGNSAGENGGVIHIGDQVKDLRINIESSTFQKNMAGTYGGVVYLVGIDPSQRRANGEWFTDYFSRANIVTVKASNFLENTAPSGGVFQIDQNGNNRLDVMEGTTFRGNRATYGGVLYFANAFASETAAEDFALDPFPGFSAVDCTFEENRASSSGGVIDMDGYVRLFFADCVIQRNQAPSGAVFSSSSSVGPVLEFERVLFNSNHASDSGGVAYFLGHLNMTVSNSRFDNNYADGSGGAFSLLPENPFDSTAQTWVMVTDGTSFLGNSAGGVGGAFELGANVNLIMTSDPALPSRRLGAKSISFRSAIVSPAARFEKNSAQGAGGALFISKDALVRASNTEFLENESSDSGGAAFVSVGSSLEVSATKFRRNAASWYGGGLLINFGSSASIESSEFTGNRISVPSQGGGGAIGFRQVQGVAPDVRLRDLVFKENQGLVGKDMFFNDPSSLARDGNSSAVIVQWNGTEIGQISCEECLQEGGDPANLLSSLPKKLVLHEPLGISASGRKSCDVLGNITFGNYQVASGSVLPPLCAVVYDAFGQRMTLPQDYTLTLQVEAWASSNSSDPSVYVKPHGSQTISLSDRVLIDQIQVFGLEGMRHIRVVPNVLYHPKNASYYDVEDFFATLAVEFVPCAAGEVYVNARESLSPFKMCSPSNLLAPPGHIISDPNDLSKEPILCPPGTHRPITESALECLICPSGYVSVPERTQCNFCETLFALSWDMRKEQCDICPEGAKCFGGARVVPEKGYFHSSMRSYQFHECLHPNACTFDGREKLLERIRNESGLSELLLDLVISRDEEEASSRQVVTTGSHGRRLIESNVTAERIYQEAQCAEGYTGPLCGACEKGYERSSLTECSKCSSRGKNIVFFTVTFVLLLIFLIFTVNKTYKRRDATSNAVKVIVAFVQQVSVLSTFRVGWPGPVNGLIAFASGISSGEITSIGCLLDSDEVPSFFIKAVVTIYIIPPCLMILIPSIMFLLQRFGPFKEHFSMKMSRGNFIVMAIIVYFFMYPFIVIETIKLFACIPVDDVSNLDQPYLYGLFASGSFLLVDTQYECFKASEWHLTAALGVGVPALIIFVVGLPLLLIVYLALNMRRFEEENFESKFGFIYVGMHLSRWWWFFIAMIRTSALAIIGMLVSNAGYQNLVAQTWLIAYVMLILYARPYKMNTLLNMEVLSVASVLVLLYIGMWMHLTKVENRWSSEDYAPLFSGLIIFAVIVALILLLTMATFIYVAVAESVNPSDLSFRDVMYHFKGITKESVSFVQKKISGLSSGKSLKEEKKSFPDLADSSSGFANEIPSSHADKGLAKYTSVIIEDEKAANGKANKLDKENDIQADKVVSEKDLVLF